MSRRFDVVLFDLDGTLTDPRVGITRSMQHALDHCGVAVDDPEELIWCIGPPLQENLARAGVAPEDLDVAVAAYRARYGELGFRENEVYPGIEDLLRALRASGVRTAVATSKAERHAEAVVDHFGMRPWFDAVAGADWHGRFFAKADVVERALALLDHPARDRTVLVGDRRHDVEGARATGVAAIGVRWGYAAEGELAAAAPDALATSVDELHHLLLGRSEPL